MASAPSTSPTFLAEYSSAQACETSCTVQLDIPAPSTYYCAAIILGGFQESQFEVIGLESLDLAVSPDTNKSPNLSNDT